MRSYSNALKAGVLGLSMLAAAPAFSSSAHAGSAPSVDIAALQQDPVHQAAIKASANKVVFVLGEGFNKFAANSLRKSLSEISMKEGNHYEIIVGASNLDKAAMIYLNGEVLRSKATGQPLVFQSLADASVEIKNLVKEGLIVTASLSP